MVLIILSVASPLTELPAGQERGPLDSPPVFMADTPKQCCRVCKKGKPCGNGCISQERKVHEGAGLRVQWLRHLLTARYGRRREYSHPMPLRIA